MLVLPGSSPLHPSQRAALLARISKSIPSITSIDAVYLHYVSPSSQAASDTLSTASPERKILESLLEYGDNYSLDGTKAAVEAALRGTKNGSAIFVEIGRAHV